MATFEVQGADGKTYEVQANSIEEAAAALGSFVKQDAGGSSANKEAVDDLQNRLTVLGANAANAAGLGFGDEAMGLKAGISSMLSGGDYLPAYQAERDKVRGNMAAVNEEFPAPAMTGKVVGGMLPALAASPMTIAPTMMGTATRGGVAGAIEGGLQGAGNADGQDMTGEVMKGAMMGGAAGLAAPALVGMAARGKNFFTEDIPSMFGKASKGGANRAIAEAIARSGKAAPDLDALVAAAKAAGQPEYRLIDALGLPGQRMGSGIARKGGAPGDEVAEFLATRQSGQGERVGSFVEDAFGVGGTTADKTKAGLIASRRDAANAAYGEASATAAPVDVVPAVSMLDDTISKMSGSGIEPPEVVREFEKLRAKLAGKMPDGSPTTLSNYDSVLALWREVRDNIDSAYSSGKGNIGEALKPIRDSLEASLATSSDKFRAATAGYREASGVINAVDEGAKMASRGRAADNIPAFQGMTAPAQGAARAGYGDAVLDKLERVTAATANRAKPLQSPKRLAEAEAMATDFPLYSGRLGRENAMWETQNRALGGSRTADNLADQDAMGELAGGAMGAVKSAANFQFGDAVAKIASMLGPVVKGGQNTATRALIAKALMSGDPMTVLAPAIAQSGKSATIRRMIEAVIRQPIREGGEALP